MSPITTHILDLARGRPARQVAVLLEAQRDDAWKIVGRGTTDDDGRSRDLLPDGTPLVAGAYRLTFDTGSYFAAAGIDAFYPAVTVTFVVSDERQHYHVPLLLSPFGYSTYRGS